MLCAADSQQPPLAAARSAGIAYIPAEVFTNNILPFCEPEDVLSLGCTNKFFATIANDETFWKRKLAGDYNFTGLGTARTSGWKFLYRSLRTPQVYIWGYVGSAFFSGTGLQPLLLRGVEEGQARLPNFPGTLLPDVPFPVKLHLPGVRVVSLMTSRTSVRIPSRISGVPSYLIFVHRQGFPRTWCRW
jgi:SCF-associated factor 1